MRKKKVLFFSDFGVDDMLAGIYAYFSEEIELVGFVADYGNVSREDALRNVKFFQQLTGIYDVPVFGGAVIPLTGESPVYYPEIHGPSGLGPIIPELYTQNSLENFNSINDVIKKYENELIIFSAGRLTSLATMFILYPEMMKKVKGIYMMGGAFQSPGNVTPVAEANIFSDPYAANLVMQLSPIKIHIIPLDVTKYAILTPEIVNELHTHYSMTKNKVGQLIKPMIDFYFNYYKKMNPKLIGSPIHDLFAIWSISDYADIKFVDVPVKICVTKGDAYGQSLGDFRETIMKSPWPVHHIAQQFNYSLFIKQVIETLTAIKS
ncbi:nucleoside hydrolase [Heyndrickxia oleronia]|uniref:nucleoside hydrolase n=1 Tax=Heyndrickxia oleronia TaxID=38875 RepID=UPI0020426791|nr:nucleoside hydrolase [Heyndrickxia oleronia]MCM3236730.1 nucleoside hydrolase [Heyndrickxia oleronia]